MKNALFALALVTALSPFTALAAQEGHEVGSGKRTVVRFYCPGNELSVKLHINLNSDNMTAVVKSHGEEIMAEALTRIPSKRGVDLKSDAMEVTILTDARLDYAPNGEPVYPATVVINGAASRTVCIDYAKAN